jgi:predicted type IV restriction endonuclease
MEYKRYTKEEGFESVKKLLSTFKSGYNKYKKNTYDESDLQQDFILPFFLYLGWDVYISTRV